MPVPDLRAKYRGSRLQESINRAIRAEIPGGRDCLDAMKHLHNLVRALKQSGHPSLEHAQAALDCCRHVADKMSQSIELRYGIPPEPPKEKATS